MCDMMCTENILEHRGMSNYKMYDIMCTGNILEHKGMSDCRMYDNVHKKHSRAPGDARV